MSRVLHRVPAEKASFNFYIYIIKLCELSHSETLFWSKNVKVFRNLFRWTTLPKFWLGAKFLSAEKFCPPKFCPIGCCGDAHSCWIACVHLTLVGFCKKIKMAEKFSPAGTMFCMWHRPTREVEYNLLTHSIRWFFSSSDVTGGLGGNWSCCCCSILWRGKGGHAGWHGELNCGETGAKWLRNWWLRLTTHPEPSTLTK